MYMVPDDITASAAGGTRSPAGLSTALSDGVTEARNARPDSVTIRSDAATPPTCSTVMAATICLAPNGASGGEEVDGAAAGSDTVSPMTVGTRAAAVSTGAASKSAALMSRSCLQDQQHIKLKIRGTIVD